MNREHFVRMVEQTQGPLRRFLCVLCGGNAFLADDLAQETLLKAYLHFGSFSGRSRFSTWLFRIGYRCFCDHCRSAAGPEPADLNDGRFARLPAETDASGGYRELYRAIGDLSEAERTAVTLFYLEERSVREIAEITGMPSGTVRSHLSRARSRLRERLEGYRQDME